MFPDEGLLRVGTDTQTSIDVEGNSNAVLSLSGRLVNATARTTGSLLPSSSMSGGVLNRIPNSLEWCWVHGAKGSTYWKSSLQRLEIRICFPTRNCTSFAFSSGLTASFHRPWFRYVAARLGIAVSISGCSSLSTLNGV